MKPAVDYAQDRSGELDIAGHLQACDSHFVPPLSQRVDIAAYAAKLARHAVRFEAWSGTTLVGLVAAYCSDAPEQQAFITSVSVLPAWQGQGLAVRLLEQCLHATTHRGMKHIDLEVDCGNIAAIHLYQKLGFMTHATHDETVRMRLTTSKDHTA